MSLNSVLRTGVSGMNAQANKLGTVADNIANTSTTGYKRSSVEFSSLVLGSAGGDYDSGAVQTSVIRAVDTAGSMRFTKSTTDLAIDGAGFFIVADDAGTAYLTRAGSFVPNASGELVNAAGYKLLGAPPNGATAANSAAGLVPVAVTEVNLSAVPTTTATLSANLASAAAIEAVPAGSNLATSTFSSKTSLAVYDLLGAPKTLDVFYTKTAASTWEVAVFDAADRPATGTFPYASPALQTGTLTFDANGALTAGGTLSVPVPDGNTATLDLTSTTQLAAAFEVRRAVADGSAPAKLRETKIAPDGTLTAIYDSGAVRELFQIALAKVAAPSKLTALSGNVYALNQESGALQVGTAGTSGLGTIASGALEQSNVDLASELTEMIEAQRSYTANSKVFQTGAEILTELVNLKR
ncbi:flagellar hook protein FlgE [Mongoliimonas terrestris]|uniref:flagellar hook protein FlgE n=1 Tax=Mongoliimonas terrestris TaxID=1709001 RepID=UPI0009495568|nr:flagellar hook protein FlgE [Mongoliimonas terrestris]